LRQLIASDSSREKTYEEKIQIADQHIERILSSNTAKKNGSKSKKRRTSKNQDDPFFDDDDDIHTNVKKPE